MRAKKALPAIPTNFHQLDKKQQRIAIVKLMRDFHDDRDIPFSHTAQAIISKWHVDFTLEALVKFERTHRAEKRDFRHLLSADAETAIVASLGASAKRGAPMTIKKASATLIQPQVGDQRDHSKVMKRLMVSSGSIGPHKRKHITIQRVSEKVATESMEFIESLETAIREKHFNEHTIDNYDETIIAVYHATGQVVSDDQVAEGNSVHSRIQDVCSIGAITTANGSKPYAALHTCATKTTASDKQRRHEHEQKWRDLF